MEPLVVTCRGITGTVNGWDSVSHHNLIPRPFTVQKTTANGYAYTCLTTQNAPRRGCPPRTRPVDCFPPVLDCQSPKNAVHPRRFLRFSALAVSTPRRPPALHRPHATRRPIAPFCTVVLAVDARHYADSDDSGDGPVVPDDDDPATQWIPHDAIDPPDTPMNQDEADPAMPDAVALMEPSHGRGAEDVSELLT